MKASNNRRITGMTAFWLVWAGQVISLLGTGMTQFAITIWAFEKTHTASSLALINVFFTVPLLAMGLVVGVMVDRYNRKLMMMMSDLAAGMITLGYLILHLTGHLQIWHLYVGSVINGVFQGFQWPAYSAAITTMLPKDQHVRAYSLLVTVAPGSNIVAPLLAGAILGLGTSAGVDGLRLILLIDITTFILATGSVLLIDVPNPVRTNPEQNETGTTGGTIARLWQEVTFGFRYILARPSLLWFQSTFLAGNVLQAMSFETLFAPMLLARTGSNQWLFGIAQTTGAIGMILGGLVIGAWGGFRRRIHGVVLGWVFVFLFYAVFIGLGRTMPLWMMAFWAVGLIAGGGSSLINSSSQAIWMAKVPPDMQGRVFTARRLIANASVPLGALSAPLADYVMEPAMRDGGALAGSFGWLVGTGPGAGMSLIMIAAGLLGIAFALSMYLVPIVRDVELLLPDHQQSPDDEQQPGTAPSPQPEAIST